MKRALALFVAFVAGVAAIRVYNQAFRNNSWRGQLNAVRSDLRNLADAQETYRAASGAFAGDLAPLERAGYSLSTGVTIRILSADSASFTADGHHRGFHPDAVCTLSGGAAPGKVGPQCTGFVTFLGRPRQGR